MINKESVTKKFGDSITFLENDSILVSPDLWKEFSNFLEKNNFDYLMCITSYDLENDNMLGLAYNFYSTKLKKYQEVRLEFNSDVEIESVANIWKTADWHEREAYDLMGIKFVNHPDMKRILLPEDWEGHPLRKDYKEPDFYNGMPVPKDKSYWE
ncbi:MAG: NADH-quinone oxidoreductase subunit C [Candidatus Marinimicrobia bacterium]|nr:NADH-quinone oxidoreductase subunit C [Candidatus Neomarinimicrobiota bacterium]|tara:strand:+ start:4062 stop:4526 length:465 start_codon:yes stop_codon:yes gene_type:complete